jgi:hypothetical protein
LFFLPSLCEAFFFVWILAPDPEVFSFFYGENKNLDKFTILSDIVTWISLCVCYFQMLTSDGVIGKMKRGLIFVVYILVSYLYHRKICYGWLLRFHLEMK